MKIKVAMKLCTSFGTRLGTQVRDFSAYYLGGARSKGFKTLRNVCKIASKLVRDIFEFFDLFFQGKEIIMRKK